MKSSLYYPLLVCSLGSCGLLMAPVAAVALPRPSVYEIYIRFLSDGGDSQEDGGVASAFGAGLVVDNLAVTGALAYAESVEG